MPMVQDRSCAVCGKRFVWSIDRPGDGYWDRWRNDSGETLASWFVGNSRCFDHAMEVIPEKFKPLLRTVSYEEWEQRGSDHGTP